MTNKKPMLIEVVNFSFLNKDKLLSKRLQTFGSVNIKTFINSALLIFWAMILVGTFRYFV